MILTQEYGPALDRQPEKKSFSFRFLAGMVLGGLLVGASLLVQLPLFVLHPGPATDVSAFITIDGRIDELNGSYHLTTVQLQKATFVEATRAYFSPNLGLVSESAIFPPDKTDEEHQQELRDQMDSSQYFAEVSALRELGYVLEHDGALIRATVKDSPADGVLRAGEVIVAVDASSTPDPSSLSEALGSKPEGSEFTLTVRGREETREVAITTISSEGEEPRPVIGVEIIQDFKLPFPIKIDAGEIGGPSAGLMFALAIYDLLDAGDLSRGRIIAGTGELNAEGTVLPIGGVTQKVAAARKIGADIFIAPSKDAKEARAAADGELRVIPVDNLREAIDALVAPEADQ